MTIQSTHRYVIAAVLAGTVALLAGCSAMEVKSPPQQKARLLKAAGVQAFRVTCTSDLWNETKAYDGSMDNVTVAHTEGKVKTYQLTGPELVSYLEALDREAHGGVMNTGDNQPEATRMYNALAPVVDTISSRPTAGAQIPSVNLDDTVAAASPSPS
ncbi:hypothetical protein ABH940_003384 [Streptacidiphilus sp. BW17]|uniref:hypothetical protein n=1 Tax=Streptacidiphilus sp. BW17 TaxID=3156274 RepID=UPI003515FDC6